MAMFSDWSGAKICGALQALSEARAFRKHIGKHRLDCFILMDLAKKLKATGTLTLRQIDTVRMRLYKFAADLADLDIKEIDAVAPDGGSSSFRFSMHNPKSLRVFLPPNSPFQEQVNRLYGLRQIEGRSFYVCDASKRNGHVLVNSGFVPDSRARAWLDGPSLPVPDIDVQGMVLELKPYQISGISFLLDRGSAILADEMGLGKTAQAIGACQHAGMSKILACVPACHKLGWAREITKFTGDDDIHVLSGMKPTKADVQQIKAHRWIVINHDILHAWRHILAKIKFDCFIMDEAHNFKNTKTKRTVAAKMMASRAPHVYALSGTPFENRPIELHSIIQMVDPALFPMKVSYADRFCDLRDGDMKGSSNTKELHKILTDTIMLRRVKAEVLPDLAANTRVVIPVELTKPQMSEYHKAENTFIQWLKDKYPKKARAAAKAEAIVKMAALKRLVATAKLKTAISWIDNVLEGTDSKLVVFAWHHEILDALVAHYGKICVSITGSTPTNKRLEIQDQFQTNDKVRLFFGNIKAAGSAITLTAASNSLTLELAWTATAHDQCEARCHRIGQKDSVTSYYMLAQGTIDERIAILLDSKRAVFSEIMDGIDMPVDSGLVNALIDEYKKL